jgi:uncharacterized protein
MSETGTEPTMEEILSSIKKIISDDSTKALSPARPRRAEARPLSHDELGEPVHDVDDDDDSVLELTQSVPEPEAVIMPSSAPAARSDALLSATAEAASRSALASLSSAMVVRPEVTGSDTLEGLVREMLKPMLKDWLDANLPEVVERVVAKEVARITGR